MTTKELERTVEQAIAWGRARIDKLDGPKPGGRWDARCQQFVRSCLDTPAWAAKLPGVDSAIEAFYAIPEEWRFETSDPREAPRGAQVYYEIGTYGHVVLAIGKTTNQWALGNDYVRQGRIDVCPRDLPRWRAKCVGWSTWTPFGMLDISERGQDWDGVPPLLENVLAAALDPSVHNTAAWRLAHRLNDLGFYDGVPMPKGIQGYPRRAVTAIQMARGLRPTGDYGPKLHRYLFGKNAR